MINYIFSALIFLVTVKGCSQETQVDEVIYTASSRGFFEQVRVTNDSCIFKKAKDTIPSKAIALNDKQKSDLKEALDKISVEKLNRIAAPSEAHTYDGAAMATLKVKKGDSLLETRTFDHGNPPKQLIDLVNLMHSFEN
ncbi:hypothetical protein [Leeuwenhoekiella sp. NPDC079379]|uniref:hypothetical protein n=1 Tax=Leeuwenhoekiella sp. NPDC079379 TaxID=3364122 RepID=UPI0037C921D6